jgi:hypothetical protein
MNFAEEVKCHYAYALALETGPMLLKDTLAGLHARKWQDALYAKIKQLQD